jgi:hypothetical protein
LGVKKAQINPEPKIGIWGPKLVWSCDIFMDQEIYMEQEKIYYKDSEPKNETHAPKYQNLAEID